jgi:hypothetical protein
MLGESWKPGSKRIRLYIDKQSRDCFYVYRDRKISAFDGSPVESNGDLEVVSYPITASKLAFQCGPKVGVLTGIGPGIIREPNQLRPEIGKVTLANGRSCTIIVKTIFELKLVYISDYRKISRDEYAQLSSIVREDLDESVTYVLTENGEKFCFE